MWRSTSVSASMVTRISSSASRAPRLSAAALPALRCRMSATRGSRAVQASTTLAVSSALPSSITRILQALVIAGERRLDRAADDLRLVEGGDQHADRRLEVRRLFGGWRAPAPRHQRAQEEDAQDGDRRRDGEQIDEDLGAGGARPGRNAARRTTAAHSRGDELGVQRRRRDPGERVERHDLIAGLAQRRDQAVQGLDGLAAVAAAVVEHHDMAAGRGEVVHHVGEDRVGAGTKVILRIDVRAGDEVAHPVDVLERRELRRGLRLGIGVVRRAEQQRRASRRRLDLPLGGGQLDPQARFRDRRQVGVRVGVIADQMAGLRAPRGRVAGRASTFSPMRKNVAGAPYFASTRRTCGVQIGLRAVVEGQRDLLGRCVAEPLHA